ncbi:hypothetical protein [Streptomyces sp. NPDC090022]|uniref:hypothetical protein n=1 Tax=Streptomyces sp. NPDC090022 TaxID=3365920 RepID=UPI00381B123E
MGAIRTSATALFSAGAAGGLLVLGALGMPAGATGIPPGAPVTSFGFAITPSTVAPGGQAVLSVTGCNAAYATVSSGVFDSVSIPRGQTVRVTVDRDARRGALYSVSFTCNGETGSTDLTITGGNSTPTTSSTDVARPVNSVAPVVTPLATGAVTTAVPPAPTRAVTATAGAVRGGLGGSAGSIDAREIGAGAGLFLVSAAGTAYMIRRRSRVRGQH